MAEPQTDEQVQEGNTQQPLVEPVLVPPRGLVAVTLALLATTAVAAVLVAPPAQETVVPSLALQLWAADARELAEMRQRDSRLMATHPALPQEAMLRRDWARWLALEAELGSLEVQGSAEARLLLGDLQERCRQLAAEKGSDALGALAARWGSDVQLAFGIVVAASQKRTARVAAMLGDPAAKSLQELAPGLGQTLADMGIDQLYGGPWEPAAAQVVRAMAAARVLQLGVRLPQPPQLPLDSEALLLRYRVEAHQGLAVERKLQLLATLEQLEPTYPAAFVRGVLLARANDCRHALPAFRLAEARSQHPKIARANAAWCRHQLADPQ